ncbi:50S ribosomal protein L18, partial [Bacillus vallismortis]|nr:50S ribosomal protein L18 [Bacillus vallismortis]
ARLKRHARVRAILSGTAERPRLNVFRSNKHIYALIIDDVNGVTIASASTLDKDLYVESTGDTSAARKVGAVVARRA